MSGARRFFWCVLRLGFAYPKKYKLEKERNTMNKVEDFINATKLNDLLNKKEDLINMTKLNELLNKKEAEEKKTSKVVWIFAIIGIIAAVAAAVYGVYRFFTPDYLEDFEDDFEDEEDDLPFPQPQTVTAFYKVVATEEELERVEMAFNSIGIWFERRNA